MATNVKTILIVGSGRLSLHLNHWVSITASRSQIKILNWDRAQDPHLIHTYVQQADDVWLAISDSAISSFYEKYLLGHDCKVVHFSGALHDPRLLCAHPLMTFTHELYSNEVYPQIHFAITGSDHLSNILFNFNNPFFILNSELKPLYHALCVISGNFPQQLWSEVNSICNEHQIPFEAFHVYLKQIVENFMKLKEAALTGPLIRKDLTTIEKNKNALPGQLKNIYECFQKEFHQ